MNANSSGAGAPELNILKTREDSHPILLMKRADSSGGEITFHPHPGSGASWTKEGSDVGTEKLRARIEPWLTALCQSEHLSLLLGSGLTHAVHWMAAGKPLPGMARAEFGEFGELIEAESKRAAAAARRGDGNIEDQFRAAAELIRGMEILALSDQEARDRSDRLRDLLDGVFTTFARSVLEGEQGILNAPPKGRERAFNYLVSFLMSFASRTGTRDRVHLFTTNYDRIIEAGGESAGMHLLDRFVGSLAPVFRSSRLDVDLHYNPPGIRGEPRFLEGVARFTKLHGSLDWVSEDRDIRRIGLPFGAADFEPYVAAYAMGSSGASRLMIYPNAAKDRETALYPYVELFRDFAAAACRPNHTLVVYGYSFGDEHINRVVEDMLTIPSTHLVVIARSDPLRRIMETYDRLGRSAQVSLLIGDHLGDLESLVDHYLPKPAIDRTTFRMAELLKARWTSDHFDGVPTTSSGNNAERNVVT
jgi:hypothetical protein